MSIFQEYEEIRKRLGEKTYKNITLYLDINKDLLLSDVYYKEEEFKKFEEWENEMDNNFRKTKFHFDCSPYSYEGYTDGQLWNGWECPRFTLETGLLMAQDFGRQGFKMVYDENKDSFIFETRDDVIRYEEYNGSDIEVNNEVIHTYPIGAWSWIWSECKEY